MRRDDEQYRDAGRPGRHRLELTAGQRQAIVARLRRDPKCSIERLRQAIPGLPRNTNAAYVRRCKRLHRRRCRRRWQIVDWHLPGAVWAIDGTWLDQPVAGVGRRALVVAELHSRQVLALRAVPGERAIAAEQVLTSLITVHGAPLVLKLDNGSAFTAKRFAGFCRAHDITLLHSPVRRPRFNGTCEVSGRWAKHRAQSAAALRGSAGPLCQADLDAAVTFLGPMQEVDPALRVRFLALVSEQTVAVAAQRGVALDDTTADHVRRSLARVAVQRALMLCHILTIQDRGYRRWLSAHAA